MKGMMQVSTLRRAEGQQLRDRNVGAGALAFIETGSTLL